MSFTGLDHCPQDGRWLIPTDSPICTEIETLQLLFGLIRALRPAVVVETGSNVGCASQVISAALEANGEGGRLFTCDIDAACRAEAARRIGAYHEVHDSDGLTLVQAMAPLADVYWIDSSEAGRLEEIDWIRQHGKAGAIVLVHDTSLMGELAQAVRAFPSHVVLPGPRGLGIVIL